VFRHEGPSRTPQKNSALAGYLAFVAGFVNSSGFVLIGSFTSHVTGSVGRLGNDLATNQRAAALFAGFLVLAFFLGALISAGLLEVGSRAGPARGYGWALLTEGALLLGFVLVAGFVPSTDPRALDAQAAILSAAMGMQNALGTRLTGAVVRTTHLTGVVTDLGIEAARWCQWQLARLVRSYRSPASTRNAMPNVARTALLLTIFLGFIVGTVLGSWLTHEATYWAMLLPAGMLALASGRAFLDGMPTQDLRP
jgi:uncharacterized membrane protein YoaK (UPF0700 family)